MKGGGKMGVKGGFKDTTKADSKDTTKEDASKGDLRATDQETALKVSKRDTGRKEMEKEVVTKERALNVVKSATRRRNAWYTWSGRWDLKMKSRLEKWEAKETHGWWQE